jgi:hypothetical protein
MGMGARLAAKHLVFKFCTRRVFQNITRIVITENDCKFAVLQSSFGLHPVVDFIRGSIGCSRAVLAFVYYASRCNWGPSLTMSILNIVSPHSHACPQAAPATDCEDSHAIRTARPFCASPPLAEISCGNLSHPLVAEHTKDQVFEL